MRRKKVDQTNPRKQTTVLIDQAKLLQLKKFVLLDQHKSFSQWVDEKMEEDIRRGRLEVRR